MNNRRDMAQLNNKNVISYAKPTTLPQMNHHYYWE
uniref:Uncharacterized protein n=1 Tax=Arundo donax TaxID=35708 RepID=A0A0A9HVJ0_ARUDO